MDKSRRDRFSVLAAATVWISDLMFGVANKNVLAMTEALEQGQDDRLLGIFNYLIVTSSLIFVFNKIERRTLSFITFEDAL